MEKREIKDKIKKTQDLMKELSKHPLVIKMAKADLEKHPYKMGEVKAPKYLKQKTEELKKLLRELGRLPEIKKLYEKDLKEIKKKKLHMKEIKGPECNGCSVCLMCLLEPSPVGELYIGTYSFNFK